DLDGHVVAQQVVERDVLFRAQQLELANEHASELLGQVHRLEQQVIAERGLDADWLALAHRHGATRACCWLSFRRDRVRRSPLRSSRSSNLVSRSCLRTVNTSQDSA